MSVKSFDKDIRKYQSQHSINILLHNKSKHSKHKCIIYYITETIITEQKNTLILLMLAAYLQWVREKFTTQSFFIGFYMTT